MSPRGSKLTERAMLVDFSVSIWEGRRKDRGVTNEVTDLKGAEQETGAWWTRTIPNASLTPIRTAIGKARTTHHRFTLPWRDEGTRILPAAMFLEYTSELRKIQSEYEKVVDEFVREYPGLIASAQKRLGKLFNIDHFPSAEVVRTKYHWSIEFWPLPDADDFRVNLGSEQVDQIQKDIQSQAETTIGHAMRDLWERLYDKVNHMVERLSNADNILKSSVVENLKDLCDLLPKLNITGDPQLETMQKTILEKLTQTPAEELRKNKKARSKVTGEAKKILATMETVLNRKGGKK